MAWPMAEALVDLNAYRQNLEVLDARAANAQTMAVVKADAYGHGATACAKAARDVGVAWLGVATHDEALMLRKAGDRGPLLSWLAAPGADYAAVVDQDVDVSAGSAEQLAEIAAAPAARRARVHLKADTGMSRGGALGAGWEELCRDAARAQHEGRLEVAGVFSHLACGDDPADPSVAAQELRLHQMVGQLKDAGVEPELVHLANSAAALTRPSSHLDLVRLGIATYGLTPAPLVGSSADFGLRPAMTLRARLALVKRVPAGSGVSYGHTYVTDRDTTLGVVPIGYGDGLLRRLSNCAPVSVSGRRHQVAGRMCMDQFVIDLGDSRARAGDVVTLFGPGDEGEPTAQEWAEAAETISYEVVTRLGHRIQRTYIGQQ